MEARVRKGIVWLIGLNILIKPIWLLGVERGVQNLVGNAEYGLYFVIYSLSFYFQVLLDPGLHSFTTRSLARGEESLEENVGQILPLKLLLGALYMVMTMAVAWANGMDNLELVVVLGLNMFFTSMLLYFRSCLQGTMRFGADSIMSVADRLLLLVGAGWLVWGVGAIDIYLFGILQASSTLVAAVVSGWLVLRQTEQVRFKWNGSKIKGILQKSWPLGLLAILMTLYTRIDGLMIQRLSATEAIGNEQAGIYAASFRLLDAAIMFPFLLSNILMPLYASNIAKKIKSGMQLVVPTKALWTAGVMLSLIIWLGQDWIYPLINKDTSAQSKLVFVCLMPTFLAHCLVYTHGAYLTAAGRFRFLNVVSGVGLLCNVALNFWLIPSYGALGAVVATLSTQGVVAVVQWWASSKEDGIEIHARAVGQFVLFHLLSIGLALVLYGSGLNKIWQTGLEGGGIVIFALLTRMVRINHLMDMFQTKTKEHAAE